MCFFLSLKASTCWRMRFCLFALHVTRRDFGQLSPNIETAVGAVTTLIERSREANKACSKTASAFFSVSIAEPASFEASAFSQLNKTMSLSLPVMEAVSERWHAEVYMPLLFVEVDTMKLFRHSLQDVQQRSLDSLHSRRKSEKYLRLHASMVHEWAAFRSIRHSMLIDKSIEFAQNMAVEVCSCSPMSRLVLSKCFHIFPSPTSCLAHSK